MCKEYAIITDIISDLKSDYIEKEKIDCIPLYYRFEGSEEIYGQDKKLTDEEFYEKLENGIRAYTMGANIKYVEDLFREKLEQGKDILCILFSSNLSVTYNVAYSVANELREEYKENKIFVIDTMSASFTEGFLVMEAIKMQKEGKKIEEVAEYVENSKLKYAVYFLVDDLKYLVLGGRLSKFSGAVGNIFNFKPVLKLTEDGKINLLLKSRGKKQAINAMIKVVKEKLTSVENFGILHANNLALAEEVKNKIEKELGVTVQVINSINHILGSHIGKDAVGIVFQGKR